MSVRKSLAWSYGTQACNFLTGFASTVVVARLLDPRDLGVFAFASAIAGFITILGTFSIHAYIVREEALTELQVRGAFTVNALLNGLLALLLLILSLVEWRLLGAADVAQVMLFLALAPVISIFEFLPAALSMRAMRYDLVSIANFLRMTTIAGATVIAAYMGFRASSMAVGQLLGGLVAALAYACIRPRDVLARPTRHGLRAILVFGLQMMSIGGLGQLSLRVCDLILGRMLGLVQLGLYSRASSMTWMIANNVYGLASRVIFARLSQEYRERGTVRDAYLPALRMLTAVMWPALTGLAVLSRPVVKLLYGEKWVGAAVPLSLLMIAQVISIAIGLHWEVYLIRKQTAQQTRLEFVRSAVGIAAFAVGCLFGIAGAAAGRVIEALTGYALYHPTVGPLAGMQRGEMGRIFRESAGLTLAAIVPALAVMLWTGWSARLSPVALGGAIGLGGVFWLALLARQDHPLMREMKAVLSRVRGRRVGGDMA